MSGAAETGGCNRQMVLKASVGVSGGESEWKARRGNEGGGREGGREHEEGKEGGTWSLFST